MALSRPMSRAALCLALTCALVAGWSTCASANTPTKAQALAYARAVNLRASDVRGGAAPPRGSFTNFAPAPLACSRTTPPRVGAVSLLADPYGFVASAVSVLPSVAVAKAQLSALLAPSGRACIPRSLGETGSIEGPDTIGFKLSSAEIPVPHVLGGEAVGFRVLAENVSPESELIKKIRETERDKGPPPGAKVIHVDGVIFRVGRSEILFLAFGPRQLPVPTMDRLLVVLDDRATANRP